jgi:hypothetical protein
LPLLDPAAILSAPVPAMKVSAVALTALASTTSSPAPPPTRKTPLLDPETKPSVSVTLLPPESKTTPSLADTLAKASTATAPAVRK